MDLNHHIVDFIRERAERRGWRSNADLARHIGPTEASWSRIMRMKQKTIKDNVANLICSAFNITPVELLLISEGQQQDSAGHEQPGPAYQTRNPELRELFQWLEHDACADQLAAVLATARAVGFQSAAKHSSPSGREEYQSHAGAA